MKVQSPRHNGRGFTLLEVVLALAVFAMAMTILVGFNARGYINEGRARRLTSAVELARQKMVDVKIDIEKELSKGAFPEDKTEEGQFDKPFDEYAWKMEIRKVELPMPPVGDEAGDVTKQMMQMVTKQIAESVREVRVTVKWNEMDKEKDFSVVTHIVK